MSRLSYFRYRLKRRYGCKHPGDVVVADITEGGYGNTQIQWCRRCGAYRFGFDVWGRRPHYDDWRIPSRWWDQ